MIKRLFPHVLFLVVLIPFTSVWGQSPLCTSSTTDKKDVNGHRLKDETGQYVTTTVMVPPVSMPDGRCFRLKEGTRFRIAVDSDITSGTAKRGDIVTFTVLENVYTDQIVIPEAAAGAGPKKTARIAVIPTGTRIFGLVEFGRSRSPLDIKGNSKLFIYVDKIILESGTVIPIGFVNPIMSPALRDGWKYGVKPCHKIKKKDRADNGLEPQDCIAGRRTSTPFNTSAINGLGGSVIGLKKTPLSVPLDAITLIDAIAGGSGVSDLINGQNSDLKGKATFEVALKSDTDGVAWALPKDPVTFPSEGDTLDKRFQEEELAYSAFQTAIAAKEKQTALAARAAKDFDITRTCRLWEKTLVALRKSDPGASDHGTTSCPPFPLH